MGVRSTGISWGFNSGLDKASHPYGDKLLGLGLYEHCSMLAGVTNIQIRG